MMRRSGQTLRSSSQRGLWKKMLTSWGQILGPLLLEQSELRRVCPGKAMGLATVELSLAQLLQGVKWVPSDFGVDLSENPKLSSEMKNSLACKAMPGMSV
jgi:hypothetical protein